MKDIEYNNNSFRYHIRAVSVIQNVKKFIIFLKESKISVKLQVV